MHGRRSSSQSRITERRDVSELPGMPYQPVSKGSRRPDAKSGPTNNKHITRALRGIHPPHPGKVRLPLVGRRRGRRRPGTGGRGEADGVAGDGRPPRRARRLAAGEERPLRPVRRREGDRAARRRLRVASGRRRMSRRGVVWRAGDWHALARLGGARQGYVLARMSPPADESCVAPMDAVDGSTSAVVEPNRRVRACCSSR